MDALVRRQVLRRREGGGDADRAEVERVVEERVVADADLALVALQHRICALHAEALERQGGAFVREQLLIIYRRGRWYLPRLYHRMLFGNLGTKERDRAHVLQRLRVDHRGHEALGR